MKRTPVISAALVTLGLATAMHLDWHVARPVVHHLSLGWRWHWLLAVPVFALTACYVLQAWFARPWRGSLTIIGLASILAAVVEPAWELVVDGARLTGPSGHSAWAFSRRSWRRVLACMRLSWRWVGGLEFSRLRFGPTDTFSTSRSRAHGDPSFGRS